jgi:hypothetical protein
VSDDSRPRYRVLQPITEKHGRFRWMRVGTAYKNPDGTIDAYLDAIVIGRRFRLRESSQGARDDFEPDATPIDPELLS